MNHHHDTQEWQRLQRQENARRFRARVLELHGQGVHPALIAQTLGCSRGVVSLVLQRRGVRT